MSVAAVRLNESNGWSASLGGSLIAHALLMAALLGWSWWQNRDRMQLGDPDAKGAGVVGVGVVTSIPIQTQRAETNRLARDTENEVPEAKSEPKTQAPEDDGVALLEKKRRPKKKQNLQAMLNRTLSDEPPSRLTSDMGRRASADMLQVANVGNLGTGNSNPFGEGLGWYAKRLRDALASKWKIDDVPRLSLGSRQTIVAFTIQRDGRVSGVRVLQSSGSPAADQAAVRAVNGIDPFVPLPGSFPRNNANVEYQFEIAP
jgi:protein TonB